MSSLKQITAPKDSKSGKKNVGIKMVREVEKIILHKKFKGEALSWQGYDLALVKMKGPWQDTSQEKVDSIVSAICLPYKGFMEGSMLDVPFSESKVWIGFTNDNLF